MITYDPSLVREYAHHLYTRAHGIAVVFFAVGALAGGLAGGLLDSMLGGGRVGVGTFVGVFLGGVLGQLYGRERAFQLRLQAQQVLCQLQVEENTRAPAGLLRRETA